MLPGYLAVCGAGKGAGLNPSRTWRFPMQSQDQPQSVPRSVERVAQQGWDCATPVWSSEKPRQMKDRDSLTLHRTKQNCLAEVQLLLCINLSLPGPKQLHQAQFIASPSPGHSLTCSRHCHAAQQICCNRLCKINPSTRKNYPSNPNHSWVKRQSTLTSWSPPRPHSPLLFEGSGIC